jgi:predicted YcjX-like family ATPase
MAATYFISRNNKMMGRFDSTEKIKALLESNATWPADTYTIVEKSDDLAAGYKDSHWGIAIKHQDGSVRLVRGGRS